MARVVAGSRGRPLCPYCRTPVSGAVWACPSCATVHHRACADENGGCTIFGCGRRRAARPSPPPAPPVRVHRPRARNAFEAYEDRVAQRANEVVKALPVVAAAVAFFGLVVGLAYAFPGAAASLLSATGGGRVRPDEAPGFLAMLLVIMVAGGALAGVVALLAPSDD